MNAAIRKSTLVLFALAMLIHSPAMVSAQSEDNRRAFLAGNGLLARGMDELAIAEYQKFLSTNTTHDDAPTARYGMGVALGRLGRHQEALETLRGIKEIRGFRFADESQIVAANAEFALGRFTDVESRLGPMLDHAGASIIEVAAPLLVESQHRAGSYQAAMRSAELVIGRFDIEALGQRGALFAALAAERVEENAKASTWASWASQNGDDPSLHSLAQLCLARTMLRSGDANGAIRISEQLAQQATDSVRMDALNILAEALQQSGRANEADRVYAQLQQSDSSSESGKSILIQRGIIAFDEGRHDEALRFFEQSADQSEEVTRWAARCETRLGRPGSAANRLDAIDSPSPDALFELAVALQHSGRHNEATANYERFLRVSESSSLSAHAQYSLASIDHSEHRYQQCADRCNTLLNDSRFAESLLASETRLLLAESLYLDGDLEGANKAFKACNDADPVGEQRLSIAYRLGMINAQLGNEQTAEAMLRSVTRGASTQPEFAPGLRTLGDLAISREDWASAISAYSAYISITDADDSGATLNLGIAQARIGQDKDALESLDAAINGDLSQGQSARAYFERGDVRMVIMDDTGAAEDWRQAILHDDNSAITTTARLRLSAKAIASGDTGDAADQLRSLIDATTSDSAKATARLDLGRLALQAGQNAEAAALLAGISLTALPENRKGEALACLSIACARAGDDQGASSADNQLKMSGANVDSGLLIPLLYERAWRHRREKNTAEAIGDYERLLQLEPDDDLAKSVTLELSDLLLESDNPKEAIARLKSVIEKEHDSHAALRLGAILYNQKDFAGAVDAFQLALDESDTDDRSLDRPRLLCGESLHHLDLWTSASTQFEIASQSDDPEISEPALLRLGSCTAQLQRWGASESAFETHLELFPDSPHRQAALFGVGWARESSGDTESAIEIYREAALGQTETSARSQFQIGECLFALGRHEEAASELIKVDILYASSKWSAAALYEAGRCFDAIGDTDQARSQWERVITTDSASDWASMARARLGEVSRAPIAGEDTDSNGFSNID